MTGEGAKGGEKRKHGRGTRGEELLAAELCERWLVGRRALVGRRTLVGRRALGPQGNQATA